MGPSDDRFPDDVQELQLFLGPQQPGQTVRAVPGMDTNVPLWLLGSSLFSAQLAAHLGLPFAFASHFAPDMMMKALEVYRHMFRPSEVLDKPYAMLGINVVAAETDEEARRLFTSQQQAFWNLRRGAPGTLPPPVNSMDGVWTPMEKAQVDHALSCAVVGSPDAVRDGLSDFIERTGADELIITAQIFDHEARKASYSIVAEQHAKLAERSAA
jgi:luciferase family oxidoreductase group 1